LGISLPIASNFTATTDLRGVGGCDLGEESVTQVSWISADTTNDRASYNYVARYSPNAGHHFTFMYTVK
jgi:hypothetical protein